MKNRSDPWDKRLIIWLNWHREFIVVAIAAFIIGFLVGVSVVMAQHQNQIIQLFEQTK